MSALPTLAELETAARLIHSVMPPTPQYRWPLLSERTGAEVWVKHENHTPVGAFKVRGGIVYFDELKRTQPGTPGVIAATRGNHGQSIAFGAKRAGVPATIVVPVGNSREKNAAMRALGATLVEHGEDFQAALDHARELARERSLHLVPSFAPLLVRGVATAYLEFFRGVPPLDTLYVPIGMGSGICGAIAARDALGLKTAIVGVAAAAAPAILKSVEAGRVVSHPVGPTIADGMACRTPDADAVDIIRRSAARIVLVSETELTDAMRAYYTDTHNLAEGAGAAALAALFHERAGQHNRRVGLVLSGGNVDLPQFPFT